MLLLPSQSTAVELERFFLQLDCCRPAAARPLARAAGHARELGLDGLASHDPIRDSIGLSLMAIARQADAAGEGEAAPLLDDVRGLVGDRVQVGGAAESD